MREVIETLNLHYCTVRTVLLKTLGAESLIELDSAPHIFESRLTEYCHVLDDYRYCIYPVPVPGTENTNCDLKIRTYIRLRTDGTECTAPTVLYTKSVNGEK